MENMRGFNFHFTFFAISSEYMKNIFLFYTKIGLIALLD